MGERGRVRDFPSCLHVTRDRGIFRFHGERAGGRTMTQLELYSVWFAPRVMDQQLWLIQRLRMHRYPKKVGACGERRESSLRAAKW